MCDFPLIFQDHIDKLSLSAEEVKGYQTASWRRWQQYIEPGDEQVNSSSYQLVDNNSPTCPDDIFGVVCLDPDPGGQKWPKKIKKRTEFSSFEVLDVLFWELKASPVSWASFMEA